MTVDFVPPFILHFVLSLFGALSFIFMGFISGMVTVCTCAPEDIGRFYDKWHNRTNWGFYIKTTALCVAGSILFHLASKF